VKGVGVGGRVCRPHYKRVFSVHGAGDEGFAVGGPGGGADGFGLEFEGAQAFPCLYNVSVDTEFDVSWRCANLCIPHLRRVISTGRCSSIWRMRDLRAGY